MTRVAMGKEMDGWPDFRMWEVFGSREGGKMSGDVRRQLIGQVVG